MQLQELLWTMSIFGFTNYVLSNFLSSCSLSLIRTWGIHPLETHDIGETMGECLLPPNQTKWAITWRIGGLEAEALHPPAMAPRPLFFAPLLGFQVPPASGSHRSPVKHPECFKGPCRRYPVLPGKPEKSREDGYKML